MPNNGTAPTTPANTNQGLGELGLGLGVLGSLGVFGGGGTVTNPDAGQANTNYDGSMTNAGEESANGMDLTGAGVTALGQYAPSLYQSDQAEQNELGYLNTAPYATGTMQEAQVNADQNNAMLGFANAKSALNSSLGARGVGGPGSSEVAGADAGIEAAEAGSQANTASQVGLGVNALRAANLAQANQVAAQHSGQIFGEGEGATTAGGGLLQGAGQLYDQTGNDWLNEGQEQIKNTQSANSAASAPWGALAGIGTKIAGF